MSVYFVAAVHWFDFLFAQVILISFLLYFLLYFLLCSNSGKLDKTYIGTYLVEIKGEKFFIVQSNLLYT